MGETNKPKDMQQGSFIKKISVVSIWPNNVWLETEHGKINVNGNGYIDIFDVTGVEHRYVVDLFPIVRNDGERIESARDYRRLPERNKSSEYQHYLHMLYEAQKCGHDVHKEIQKTLDLYAKSLGI